MIRKLLLIASLTAFVACAEQFNNSTPEVENPEPEKPIELTPMQRCANGSIQNALAIQYNFASSQPMYVNLEAYAFPLAATFRNKDEYFDGSSINVHIVHHAMGGDVVLFDGNFDDTNDFDLSFDAFTDPSYMATPGDEFTITITSDMVVTYNGKTQTYPHHIDVFNYTLAHVSTTLPLQFPGEMRIYEDDLECPDFLNPIVSFETQGSGTPGEYDINAGIQLVTHTIDTFLSSILKSSKPSNFSRAISVTFKDEDGNELANQTLDPNDATADAYGTFYSSFGMSIPPGDYEVEIQIEVGANDKVAILEKIYGFTILPDGEIQLDGKNITSKMSTPLGLSLFQ